MKMGKGYNQEFTAQDIKIANNHMNICTTSVIMQAK